MVDNPYTLHVVKSLREKGYNVDFDLLERSVKAQFKYANKINAKYTITIGEDEKKTGKLSIKDMSTGQTEYKKLEEI